MLVQLMPEQISTYWEQIRYSIESAAPPTVSDKIDMNNILQSILADTMQVWVSVDKPTGRIAAIVVTTIVADIGMKRADLLIYSLFGLGDVIGKDNWKDGFDTLRGYARSRGCGRVTAYTQSDAIKKLAKWFGGYAEYTYITIDAMVKN